MPERDPRAQEVADRRTRLAEVMEEAVRWLRLQLRTGAGADARAYLDRRGLDEAKVERWEIGFAPDQRQGMFRALSARGIDAALLNEAGLCAIPDDGGEPYDRFRGRIIFPIRDARGRAIALGGRSLDPAARSKYLNSPETPLFDKGRNLYNLGPARDATGKGQPLIVAEGYMDTIALSEAGFAATVAPLGTAITEAQLHLLWRLHPEPIIALDGDTAGRRAAMRLVDLALPMIEAGRSLRFAILPAGQDPDDLLRAGGHPAMEAVLEAAVPLVRMLWDREYGDGGGLDTPEAKAGLDRRLGDALRLIRDRSVARYYADAMREFRFHAFRPANWAPRAKGKPRVARASQSVRGSLLAGRADRAAIETLRERVVLASLIANPEVTSFFEYALEGFDFVDPEHQALASALLKHWRSSDAAHLPAELDALGLSRARASVTGDRMIRVLPGCRAGAEPDLVKMTVAGELAWIAADRAVRREVEESEEDIFGPATEALTWRLSQAAAARSRADRGPAEDRTEWEVAANGLRLSRDERGAFESVLRSSGIGPAALEQDDGRDK